MKTDSQLAILFHAARVRDFSLTLMTYFDRDKINLDLDRYVGTPQINIALHSESLPSLLQVGHDLVCSFPERDTDIKPGEQERDDA